MIDKNKQYKTRDGREVRIYATDGCNGFRVHGAVYCKAAGWEHRAWFADDGRHHSCTESPLDLIEVKPRIKREVWVNVYPNGVEAYSTRHSADFNTEPPRIACVCLTIDVEEGTGL